MANESWFWEKQVEMKDTIEKTEINTSFDMSVILEPKLNIIINDSGLVRKMPDARYRMPEKSY